MRKYNSSKQVNFRHFTSDAHASSYYSLIPNVGYRSFKGGKTFKSESEFISPKGRMIKRVKSNKKGFELSATYMPRSTSRRLNVSSRRRLNVSSRR
jgi:hypothetical protein